MNFSPKDLDIMNSFKSSTTDKLSKKVDISFDNEDMRMIVTGRSNGVTIVEVQGRTEPLEETIERVKAQFERNEDY